PTRANDSATTYPKRRPPRSWPWPCSSKHTAPEQPAIVRWLRVLLSRLRSAGPCVSIRAGNSSQVRKQATGTRSRARSLCRRELPSSKLSRRTAPLEKKYANRRILEPNVRLLILGRFRLGAPPSLAGVQTTGPASQSCPSKGPSNPSTTLSERSQ